MYRLKWCNDSIVFNLVHQNQTRAVIDLNRNVAHIFYFKDPCYVSSIFNADHHITKPDTAKANCIFSCVKNSLTN